MGKTAGDLVGSDIQVTKSGDVLGTLHYVGNYEGFSNDPEEQQGYYFPFHLGGAPGEKMTLSKNGEPKKKGIPYDPDIIVRLESPSDTATVGVDGSVVVKLNFARANFEPKGKISKKASNEALTKAAESLSEYATVSVSDGAIDVTITNEEQDINTDFGKKILGFLAGGNSTFRGVYVKGHPEHKITITTSGISLLNFTNFVQDSGLAGSNKLKDLKTKSFDIVFVDIYDGTHEYKMSFN